jgi:hypothetical protein
MELYFRATVSIHDVLHNYTTNSIVLGKNMIILFAGSYLVLQQVETRWRERFIMQI